MSLRLGNVTIETAEGVFVFDDLAATPRGKVVESTEGDGRPTRDGEVFDVEFDCYSVVYNGVAEVDGEKFNEYFSEETQREIKDYIMENYEDDLIVDLEENWDDEQESWYDAVGKYLLQDEKRNKDK